MPVVNVESVHDAVYDAFRFARNNDDRMTEKVTKYLDEGMRIPSVVKQFETKAILDAQKFATDEFCSGNIASKSGARGKIFETALNILGAKSSPENRALNQIFEDMFRFMYPKTKNARLKIMRRLAQK